MAGALLGCCLMPVVRVVCFLQGCKHRHHHRHPSVFLRPHASEGCVAGVHAPRDGALALRGGAARAVAAPVRRCCLCCTASSCRFSVWCSSRPVRREQVEAFIVGWLAAAALPGGRRGCARIHARMHARWKALHLRAPCRTRAHARDRSQVRPRATPHPSQKAVCAALRWRASPPPHCAVPPCVQCTSALARPRCRVRLARACS